MESKSGGLYEEYHRFLKTHGVSLRGLCGLLVVYLLLSLVQPEVLRHASLAITGRNTAYLIQTLGTKIFEILLRTKM